MTGTQRLVASRYQLIRPLARDATPATCPVAPGVPPYGTTQGTVAPFEERTTTGTSRHLGTEAGW